jgi:lactate racemase
VTSDVLGHGQADGFMSPEAVRRVVTDGLARLPLDGRRILVIIPDGTRTMPMPLLFGLLEETLGPRAAAMDFLVALGTHSPMSDAELSRLVGRPVSDGWTGRHHIFNHRWDDPSVFVTLGTIPASEMAMLSGGRLEQAVPVALNRLVTDYQHVIICGPVFPHEVAGFSGGTKYLFPGIAAPDIIHVTHWLGALVTSYEIIGTLDTPVRAVINRAASLLDVPLSLLALVVTHEGIAGAFVGDPHVAWRRAALLSARRHITWVDRPFDRMLAVMPEMYDDLWTGAKGAYKAEPAIADGGEVVIFAPHIREVSHVHGRLIDEIGYHCRDYFLKQWDRFGRYPGGILAHSTHVKGLGAYDAGTQTERPRIRVTLATGIPEERCRRINLGYRDPATVNIDTWAAEAADRSIVVPRAGESLFRVGKPPEEVRS